MHLPWDQNILIIKHKNKWLMQYSYLNIINIRKSIWFIISDGTHILRFLKFIRNTIYFNLISGGSCWNWVLIGLLADMLYKNTGLKPFLQQYFQITLTITSILPLVQLFILIFLLAAFGDLVQLFLLSCLLTVFSERLDFLNLKNTRQKRNKT